MTTMDRVRRNLLVGIPATAISATTAARPAFANSSGDAGRTASARAHEAFRRLKENFVDQTIETTRTALVQDNVVAALKWEAEFPQSALFRAIDIPLLPAHLNDTKYDYSELRRRYPVQFGVMGMASGSHRHILAPRIIPAIDKRPLVSA